MMWGPKLLTILSMVILARVLGPENFGLVALAMISIGFVDTIVTCGVAPAIVQRRGLEPADLDSIFWLNVAAGVTLSLVGFASSDLLGLLSDSQQVPTLFAALSPLILVRSLTVVQQGLATRDQRFRELAIRNTASTGLGSLCGISAALFGLGIWSLVIQAVVTDVVGAALLWKLAHWQPRLRFEWARARSFMRFASGMLSSQIATFVGNQCDVVIVGALFGPIAVGILRFSMRIVNIATDMLVRPVQVIALPRLSELQHDHDALRAETLRLMRISSLIMMPAIGALIVSAETLALVLGDEWHEATTALRILALIGAAKSISLLAGPALLAIGRSHTVALGSWAQCIATILLVTAIGMWARDFTPSGQVAAIAVARTVSFVALFVPLQMYFLSRALAVSMRSVFAASAPGLEAMVATVGVGIAVHLASVQLGAPAAVSAWLASLSAGIVAATLVYRTRKAMMKANRAERHASQGSIAADDRPVQPPVGFELREREAAE